MKTVIDINADLGEGFPHDTALLSRVSSANICCGAHAGDPDSISATLRAARDLDVNIGAHPGFADRDHFGRRPHEINAHEARELVLEQVDALGRLAEPLGVTIRYLKPHGALYNQAHTDTAIATGIVEAASMRGLPVVGLPGGELETAARLRGVRFVAEGFADRGYSGNGALLPRDAPCGLLSKPGEIVAQVQMLAGETLELSAQTLLSFEQSFGRAYYVPCWDRVETICIHGDRDHAADVADLVRATLRLHGVEIKAFA